MITTRFFALLIATCALVTTPARAQCLEWRGGFGAPTGGANGSVFAQTVFDDGSGPALYVGGDFTSVAGDACRNFARWDGARWTGLLDDADGDIFALAVFDDGTGPALYAAGEFTNLGGTLASRIAKWTGSGFVAIGAVNDAVNELLVFDDGNGPQLYMTGLFTNAGGVNTTGAARWNGSTWSALNLGAGARGYALGVYDDGGGAKLYVGGVFSIPITGGPAINVARWNGASWSRLGTGVNGGVNKLDVYAGPSGPELYAGGAFTTAGGGAATYIARWNGSSWSALPSTPNGVVFSMLVHDDGSGSSLFVTGPFNMVAGAPAGRIARWDGTAWSSVGGGCDDTVYTLARFDEGSGPRLFAGGIFDECGGLSAPSIGRWDGSAWSTIGPGIGLAFDVRCFETHDDGSGNALYAGGTTANVTGVETGPVVRWTGTSWAGVGTSQITGYARHLDRYDDGTGPKLYATGGLGIAGQGTSAARWDGATWTRLGSGPQGDINATAVFDDGNGPDLYCGGYFNFVDGVGMPRIARWNANGWSWPNNIWPDGTIFSMAVYDDGSGPQLYIGGNFTNISSWGPANYVVRWDGTNWSTLGSGTDGTVLAMQVFDDGGGTKLYMSGTFSHAGGIPVTNLARWDGTSWSSVPGTFNSVPTVLAVHDDGGGSRLYAAGSFTSVSGRPARHLARLSSGTWAGVGGGVSTYTQLGNESIAALASFDDGAGNGADLWIGGNFEAAGTERSENVAVWNGCVGTSGAFCFGDGSGTPCPCFSSAPDVHAGCRNSLGTGGRLVGSGSPSIALDTFTLDGSGMPDASALYFQGTQEVGGGIGLVFGDGLRCAGGSVARLKTVTNSGGASRFPDSGDPSISVRGGVMSPGSRTYQVWYRNAASFCTSATFNLTNGVRCAWTP